MFQQNSIIHHYSPLTGATSKVFIGLFYISVLCGLAACFNGGGGGGGGGAATPGVLAVDPTNGATSVEPNVDIVASFIGDIDPVTVDDTSFTLQDSLGNPISGTVSYDTLSDVATFVPDNNLALYRTFNATISDAVTYASGTKNITAKNWSFTTRDGWWDGAVQVDENTTATSEPHIAVSGNGDAVAIWINGVDVYANNYTATSGSWGTGSAIKKISSTNFAKSYLQVAMDANGNAIALWSAVQGGATNLRSAFYTGSTQTWGSATLVETSGGVADHSHIAFDASGNALAVWLQQNDIYYNQYSSGSWGTATTIESAIDVAYTPQLAVFNNGDAVAVWAQDDSVAGYKVIYANYYTAGGTWSGRTPLPNSDEGILPQVAVDQNGNAIAIWLQGTGPYSIQAAFYDGASSSWDSVSTTLDSNAATTVIPQVTMDKQGNVIAMWRDPTSGSIDRLHYKRYSSGSWGAVDGDGHIDNGMADTFEPQLAMDAVGNAIVVWRQYTDSTIINSVWYNRYQTDSGWGTPDLLELNDVYAISTPGIGANANGYAFGIWIQSDGSANSTWVNHFK